MDLLTDPEPITTPAPVAAEPAPAAPAAATPAPAAEKSWIEALPPDLRENGALLRYKESGLEGLARGYLNAERLISSEKVPVPKDANDQEAWDRYYKAGGRPEEPTKYEFKRPETLPEGVVYDEGMEGWWKQSAFEAGLSQRQAERLYRQYADRFVADADLRGKNEGQQVTTAAAELQRDWGAEYEARRALAKAAFAEMPADARAAAVAAGLARMPSYVKYLYDIKAKTTGETSPHQGNRPGAALTAEGQQAKLAEFRQTYKAALEDGSHPDHKLRLSEMSEMYTKLYPVEAA